MPDTKQLTDQFLSVCDETPDSTGFVRELLTRVGDKWSILVIATLARGSLRFTKLHDAIPGISHRMLTVTLRALATDGLVSRISYGEVPPRVEYALTPLGETLLEPILALVAWADEHHAEIESGRRQHRTASPV